jgi:hypothetical protein
MPHHSDQSDDQAPPMNRVITATRQASNSKLLGSVDILAYTKHGSTAMISVSESQKLSAGDILKTSVWILNAKHFIVIGPHQKPMKLAGAWFEVQAVTP